MTYVNDVFGQPLFKDTMGKMFIGFDEHFNRLNKIHNDLSKSANYPPYNIRRISESRYAVDVAAAGFSQEDFDITLENGMLIVKGSVERKEDDGEFLFKGIAKRAFTRSFALDEFIEVKGASFVNGVLTVYLEKVIPEHKQPKKIPISGPVDNKHLLLE